MRKIIAITVGVLALVALGSWYYLFHNGAVSNISIAIDHPDEVQVGSPFTVSVRVSNDSDKILSDSDIALTLPAGMAVAGEDPNDHLVHKSLGDVGPGSVTKEDFTVIALTEPDAIHSLSATVTYAIANNPKARFEATEKSDIRNGALAIPISFSVPDNAVSGDPLKVKVHYQNNTAVDYANLRVKVSLPPNFQFSSADPDPDRGNNEWEVPELKRGESGDIEVNGMVSGPDQSAANFDGSVILTILGRDYTITKDTARIAIAPSSLFLWAELNDKTDYVAHLDDSLSYTIHYKNKAPTGLQNIVITASLKGELYDIASVSSNGSLNSVTNTLTWNAANTPGLAFVDGGMEGEVTFSIKTKTQFPIARIGDKNYTLSLSIRGESPTVPAGQTGGKTVSVASFLTGLQGLTTLDAKAYYKDPGNSIITVGPYPPRANQPTQYVVHWVVRNYATNVSNATVAASLQSGARVVKILPPAGGIPAPTYNAASAQITWNIGAIAATKGVVGAPLEAVFIIEQTPAITQVGQTVTLMGESRLSAHDDFVDRDLSATAHSVTTELPDDASVAASDHRVQP
jgi:hypothetical protein